LRLIKRPAPCGADKGLKIKALNFGLLTKQIGHQ
jgi:hypothetical protein